MCLEVKTSLPYFLNLSGILFHRQRPRTKQFVSDAGSNPAAD